ncbi:MAG: hypothetical protein PWQ55_636 [Chloroflexota bacterium]|nr:hypothetical protein [Chloroflexota bacterium]
MGVKISINNHCDCKLDWDEEYPSFYLFSTNDFSDEKSCNEGMNSSATTEEIDTRQEDS